MKDEKETLALIGMTKDELRERVVKSIVHKLLHQKYGDEDGEWENDSAFAKELDKNIKQAIDDSVTAIADAHVKPVIMERIENIVLQKTTSWGEKEGKPLSFVEYLIQRADFYMNQEVDHNGRPKSKDHYSQFTPAGTRLAHMVDTNLSYAISSATKTILKGANESIAEGIQGTVKIRLKEILEGIQLTVKMPR